MDEDESYCPKCHGEIAFEDKGYRCVEQYDIFIGCGWKADYDSGDEDKK